jgi:energy-coupling factor transport system permease protein
MGEFEFLGRVTIGQYLPLDSILHRLDPRARILSFSIFLGALTFAPRPFGLILGLLVVLTGLWAGRIPLAYALRGLLPPLPFLLILAVLQIFINPYPDSAQILLAWGRLNITSSDLLAGGMLLLRFASLILGISLATFTLSTSELIGGLNSLLRPLARIGLPAQDFVTIVQITLRFLPFLAQSAERIAKAQAARGAAWSSGKSGLLQRVRQITPIIVPLFLTSLRRAENTALAMDSRGYGSQKTRSSIIELQFKFRDAAVLGLAVLSSAIILLI